ncbi:MAG TPA: PQQ-dependent sugar dehydrogenase [Pirellulales bacterium]|jgi:glucose/arabinose dehydrogenase|nr:PQQ-dependent sugar dehydrogenase [Pirellulales bacterium]
MKTLWLFLIVAVLIPKFLAAAEDLPQPVLVGLKNPSAAAVSGGGKIYVAVKATSDEDVKGAIVLIENDKAVPFAEGLNEIRALAAHQKWFFAAERQRIQRIDGNGKADVYVETKAFPIEPRSLGALVVDPQSGIIYVCDAGDGQGKGAAIYRISPQRQVSLVLDAKKLSSLQTPSGLVMDGASHLILLDAGSGDLHRIKLADSSTERLAQGLAGCEGLVWDRFGRLVIGDPKARRLLIIPRPGDNPIPMVSGIATGSGMCLSPTGKQVLVPDPETGTLTGVPIVVPGADLDQRPLAIETELAFPDLQWTGWTGVTDNGKPNPLRPILLTNAGDGSDRVFVPTQQGVVHVFPNDQTAKRTKIFLDLSDRVVFNEQTQDEGFLGLAFHPNFKQNGEFFVFYTTKKAKLTNVLSRFKVSKDDPTRADPNSEEELIRFVKPSWNHDGGTVCFGPDGYLYVTHGDGGFQMDPYDNGQNLQSLMSKVLRIDVDHRDDGKNYAIPKDNPFVGRSDARPEIWAYGFRCIWRMAFDNATGALWAADVGQDLYEEIDLIQRGGNFGWNRREGLHPFGPKGKGASKEFIDPIWEYRHDAGVCIIGGCVYRGKRLPELQGYYVYADYSNGKLFALRYDPKLGRVVENRTIKDRRRATWSFGEDERGEVYLLSAAPDGRGIFRYATESGDK